MTYIKYKELFYLLKYQCTHEMRYLCNPEGVILDRAWWSMSAILALWRLRVKGREFSAAGPCPRHSFHHHHRPIYCWPCPQFSNWVWFEVLVIVPLWQQNESAVLFACLNLHSTVFHDSPVLLRTCFSHFSWGLHFLIGWGCLLLQLCNGHFHFLYAFL